MKEAAGRVFASHYQFCVCDDPKRAMSEKDNWNDSKVEAGFAGNPSCRLVGTEADQNDHWVEILVCEETPKLDEWQRVTCIDFVSSTGRIHVMSVVDDQAAISLAIPPGKYSLFVAVDNLGVDQWSLGEDMQLSDAELRDRRDLERYWIFVVPNSS